MTIATRVPAPTFAAVLAATRRPEADGVRELLRAWPRPDVDAEAVRATARTLVENLRSRRADAVGVDTLLQEFTLSSQEGVALMCLAEALLRIPDDDTADALIRDKLRQGDWGAHVGHSPSLFVNAAAWGLLLGGRLLTTDETAGLGAALRRLVARGGEPVVRRAVDTAMRLLGQHFVSGQSIADALANARAHDTAGFRRSYDMLGEAALTMADAVRYEAAYADAIAAIGAASEGRGAIAGPGISIKLSALHPRYQPAQRDRVHAELWPRLVRLLRLARAIDIGVNIDAEESTRLVLSLELFERLATDPTLAGWPGLGFVVQAYQKRAPCVIDHLITLARGQRRRFMLRLVKGAYWDSEIKLAQTAGHADYPVYTRKAHTDLAYLACAQKLLDAPDAVYPQFATHNAQTVAAIVHSARARGHDDYEFQCLHGMGEDLFEVVVRDLGKPCRVYSPVGSHETLLPYLVRRLLENGANNSFVHRVVDVDADIDELIADPSAACRASGGAPHPRIPLPAALYGPARRNAHGLALDDDDELAALMASQDALASRRWHAAPMTATPSRTLTATGHDVLNPADRNDIVGTVVEASPADIDAALAQAEAGAAAWQAVAGTARAAVLDLLADAFERERMTLTSLCVREAGKTLPAALAEVREAVDSCRYYAQQVRTQLPATSMGLGVVACISPWNFPLAICVGQIVAALAAGNAVIAKPAEQTPLTAAFVVELAHAAGVSTTALQLLPGNGEDVGDALVRDPRVRGVLFTGSTTVAQRIQRTLRTRAGDGEIPLVAETGGINAMVVDSSALLEQAAQDAITSAFDSAGQRCSALRLLCVQDDVAEPLLRLLRGAMDELVLGATSRIETDVGPIIDAAACARVQAHVDAMRARGYRVYQAARGDALSDGSFLPPTLIELDTPGALTDEIFGPVLHVVRYARTALDRTLDAIEASGYGLTFGLHSRIDSEIARICARVRAGNVYVNRNMIGAVVGVQPFGGEGRSGTGPKAGGPLLVHRLLAAQWATRAALPDAERMDEADDPAAAGALAELATWADGEGRTALAGMCRRYAAASLLGWQCVLAGPTGERNVLRFAPLGTLLACADNHDALLRQLAAALASGNRLRIAQPNDEAVRLIARLPAAVRATLDNTSVTTSTPRIAGILCSGASAACATVHDAHDDTLRPEIRPNANGDYPLFRLLHERVVSSNTTAAGGNASLLTLAD